MKTTQSLLLASAFVGMSTTLYFFLWQLAVGAHCRSLAGTLKSQILQLINNCFHANHNPSQTNTVIEVN